MIVFQLFYSWTCAFWKCGALHWRRL